MRKILGTFAFALAAPLALIATPVAAQDDGKADDAAMLEALGAAFAVEPLTTEQQARLPLARSVIARVLPPGSMQDMTNGMFGGMLSPFMQLSQDDPTSVITGRFGYDVTSSPEAAAEVAAILDPAWAERRRREAEAVPQIMGQMISAMEPTIRNVMAEMYAVHFTAEELTGIDVFFTTPIGATYARKSFSMSSDPRLMGSMMQAMPTILGSMGGMEAELTALTADLPPERAYADLTKAERSRLAELAGMPEEDLQYYLDGDSLATEEADEAK